MAYGLKYIMSFNNLKDEFYEVYFEFLDYVGPVSPIVGTDDCITLQSTSADKDKLLPILGTECLININVDSTSTLSIFDFIATTDEQVRVTIYKDNNYDNAVFQGFVSLDFNTQPFIDPPFTISLRALDGLGLLQGVDLADTLNVPFSGNFSIIQWIAQILYKTGQLMSIRVYFDMFNTSFHGVTPFDQIYLNSTTFSKGDAFNPNQTDLGIDNNAVNADDCATALEKIMRCFRCRLFQQDGYWHIINIYSYTRQNGYIFTQYSMGTPVSGLVPVTTDFIQSNLKYDSKIGKNELIYPLDNTTVGPVLATKWIQLNYNYNQSQNKVCNQTIVDFSPDTRLPTLDQTISSSVVDPTVQPPVNFTCLAYQPYCWTHFDAPYFRLFPQSTAAHQAYIRQCNNPDGFTDMTFFVIETSNTASYLKSSEFLIDQGDELIISFDARYRNTATQTNMGYMLVILHGDDGSNWSLHGISGAENPENNSNSWENIPDINTATFIQNIAQFYSNGLSSGTWTNVDANAPDKAYLTAAPVNGNVTIYLASTSNEDGPGNEVWFKNIQIQINPYIQGSYLQATGDYNFSGSNQVVKQSETDSIEISDSPKRYFLGALVQQNGDLLPSNGWYNRDFASEDTNRFTQLMERIMYNQLYRIMLCIQGTFSYLKNADISDARPNGFLNSYYFTDSNFPTKKFMCTSFAKHLGTGTWDGTFVECTNDINDNGWTPPDNYEFNYTFSAGT